MADLYKIFNDEGLAGLLPYALKPSSHGYQILIDKIKAGIPLSFIRTHMEAPFLVVKNGTYQAMFYTTREKAQEQADNLSAQGYKPTVEDLPDGQGRQGALLWLFDYGPTHILLDDTVSVPISDLADEIPEYDGQPTEEHMLRNRMMNGALFYFLQQAAAGFGNLEAERTWTQAMHKGLFLAACVNDAANNYPPLSIKVKGQNGILIYTDWRQVQLDHEENPSCVLVTFDMLKSILEMYPGSVLVLNHATCSLIMDSNMLDMIEQSATDKRRHEPTMVNIFDQEKKGAYTLGQVSEEDWDKVDPTPDFLK